MLHIDTVTKESSIGPRTNHVRCIIEEADDNWLKHGQCECTGAEIRIHTDPDFYFLIRLLLSLCWRFPLPRSNPCWTASFPLENEGLAVDSKDSPNILGVLGEENEQNVKFPKRLRYKGKVKVLATIYKRTDCYRVYWRARVDGKPKSRFKEFTNYAACKREADKIM